MEPKYEIVTVREHPEWMIPASGWFHAKWGIPQEAYRASMEESLQSGAVPQWYLAVSDGEIVGGLGIIENDFHNRKDLTPNICAVYVEEAHRCRGIAGRLLERACGDLAEAGIPVAYLLTDHTAFYERYGWEFFCMVSEDGGGMARMYRHVCK